MNRQRSTAGEMIAFSLPLILSGILQQLYSWADAFIVGHVEGELPLAAIGATQSVSFLLINMAMGFTLGLSILAGQHFGRRDTAAVQRLLGCFLRGTALAFTALSAAAFLFAGPILRLMNTPADILTDATDYLRIIFVGVPFLAVYNLYAAFLRAVGNSKAAFYAVLLSSVSNIVLDVLFIAVFGWGVTGAAAATVIAQIAMTVFIVWYARRQYDFLRGGNFDRETFRQGLRFSIPPALQNSVTSLGNLVLQNFMNSFGSVTVLAITTAYRVDSMMLLPIFNLGAAVSSMAARAKGANDAKRLRSCFVTGHWLMLAVTGTLSVIMFVLGAHFIAIFGVGGEALAAGRQFFRDLSVFYALFGAGIVLRSVLEGVGDVTCCSLIGAGMLGVRIALSYMLRPVLAGRTIAIAEGIAWVLMLGVLVWRTWYMHRKKQKSLT